MKIQDFGEVQSTSLNIAILPSTEVAAQAIEMSKKILTEMGSRYLLGFKTLIPHITVYQAQYPNKNIAKLKNIIEKFVLDLPSFRINLDAITVSHGTFLFWNCEKNKVIQDIHEKVVALANPLREGIVLSQLADRTNLTPEDKSDIEKFGALLIGPRYEPHITITRLNRENDAEKAIKLLSDTKNILFKPKSIILGYLGDHGTVTEIIEEFPFNQLESELTN
jgi:2'-5' RNA ligase